MIRVTRDMHIYLHTPHVYNPYVLYIRTRYDVGRYCTKISCLGHLYNTVLNFIPRLLLPVVHNCTSVFCTSASQYKRCTLTAVALCCK